MISITIGFVSGYLLGKITCNFHYKHIQKAILIFIFIATNILHSIVDGILFTALPFWEGVTFTLGHEVLRQPLLFMLWIGMTLDFKIKKSTKVISALAVIFIPWALGIYFAKYIPIEVKHINLTIIYAFLCGDIVHHIIDYITHKRLTK